MSINCFVTQGSVIEVRNKLFMAQRRTFQFKGKTCSICLFERRKKIVGTEVLSGRIILFFEVSNDVFMCDVNNSQPYYMQIDVDSTKSSLSESGQIIVSEMHLPTSNADAIFLIRSVNLFHMNE